MFGGNLFVDAATEIALSMGVSETVVGLTLVAAGTSLRNLLLIVAAREGKFRHCNRNVVKQYLQYFLCTGFCDRISDACGEYFVFRFRAYAFKYPDSLVFLLHKTDD